MDAVLFDLDGTLLPMDQEAFVRRYLMLLGEFMAEHDYEPKALIQVVWEGTRAMMENDGSQTNEERFWQVFRRNYGPRVEADRPLFEEFYATAFAEARTCCGFAPESREIVEFLKEHGIRRVLATNPLFPKVATYQRIRWAGLDPADFEWVTTYDNSSFCKPNPAYYRQILDTLGLSGAECVMVGNDLREDMVASRLDMDCFLLTPCLLHGEEGNVNQWPNGDFDDLKGFLEGKIAEKTALTGA